MAPDTALLLLGHGSHVDGHSSDPIHEAARRLRGSGRHPEVRVAFWKEEPQLRDAFLLVESPRVVAVPIFTSEGYFTDGVIPRELGVTPPLSRVGHKLVRYTRPVGTHPRMAGVVLERAREALRRAGAAATDATLLVLGHGTERHRASGDVVQALTDELARTSGFADVRYAFLDQEPRIVPALEALLAARAVVVPFFIAEGWHVGQTIPRDLGLEDGRARIGGTEIWFTGPVGTHPALDEVILQIAAEADAEGWGSEPEVGAEGVKRTSLAAEAREAFVDWIDEGAESGRTFLETRVRWTGSGRYEVRHVEDARRDGAALARSSDPEGALDIARRDKKGGHRPLRTAPDLAAGWLLEGLTARGLWEAYAHLYPVAPVHWYLGRQDRLSVAPFRSAAARQTGIYAPVRELDDDQVEAVARSCCGPGSCLRRVVWPLEEGGEPVRTGKPGGPAPGGSEADFPAAVPCPESCSLFFTRAREHLDHIRGPAEGSHGDPSR